eukprot:4524164-Amphidinium_carterae.1
MFSPRWHCACRASSPASWVHSESESILSVWAYRAQHPLGLLLHWRLPKLPGSRPRPSPPAPTARHESLRYYS